MTDRSPTTTPSACLDCNRQGSGDLVRQCIQCFKFFCDSHLSVWNDHALCYNCARSLGLCPNEEDANYWNDLFLQKSISESELSPLIDPQSLVDATRRDERYQFVSPSITNAVLRSSPGASPSSLTLPLAVTSGGIDTRASPTSQRNVISPSIPPEIDVEFAEDGECFVGDDGVMDVSDEEVGFILLVKRLFQICGGYVPLGILALETERKGLHQTDWAAKMGLTSGARMTSYMEIKGFIVPRGQELCFKLSDLATHIIKEYIEYLAVRPEIQANALMNLAQAPFDANRLSFVISRNLRIASQRRT